MLFFRIWLKFGDFISLSIVKKKVIKYLFFLKDLVFYKFCILHSCLQ